MLLKYKDFKMISKDEMKQVIGGNAPVGGGGGETHCGACTDMNGTPLEKSNVVCSSFPTGTICQDMHGQYNMALFCGTSTGTLIEIECPYIGS